jgi:hypothetical protein
VTQGAEDRPAGAAGGFPETGSPPDAAPPRSRVRRYPPQPFEPVADPTVSFEVVTVDGEEGRELRATQARAIRDLLAWVHLERQRRMAPEEHR